MLAHVVHAVLFALILIAWRIGVLWFSPFKDGKRRLGAGRVAKVRASLRRSVRERWPL